MSCLLTEAECCSTSNLAACVCFYSFQAEDFSLTHVEICLQLGNLLGLKPIDLAAAALPTVGVPPLDVSDLLGVQFLGFSIANFSVLDARLSVSSDEQTVLIPQC